MSPRDIISIPPLYYEEDGDEARELLIQQEEIANFPQEKRNEIGRAIYDQRMSYRKYIQGCLSEKHASKNLHYTDGAFLFLFENPIMEEFMSNIDEIMNEDIQSYYDFILEDIFYYNDTEPLVEHFRGNPFTEFLDELMHLY